jgi:hypothetical protein
MAPACILQSRHALDVLFPLRGIRSVVVALVVECHLVLGIREIGHCQESSPGVKQLNVHARCWQTGAQNPQANL